MPMRLTSGGPLRDVIARAVEEYNAKRGGEAHAEIVAVRGDKVYVKVSGHFCFTCGVNEWVNDVKYMLEEQGLEAELVRIIEPEDPEEPWRIAVFRVRPRASGRTAEAVAAQG